MSGAYRSDSGVYTSPWGKLAAVEPGTIYDYAFGDKRRFRDEKDADTRISLRDYVTGETWTLKQYRDDINALAATLLSNYGVRRGDKVLISLPPGPNFALLTMACSRAGLVMALANPAYTSHELKHVVNLVDARLILTVAALRQNFLDAGLPEMLIVDGDRRAQGERALWRTANASQEDATKTLADAGCDKIDWREPAGIFFSSGTTGLPKAVLISHSNIIHEYQIHSQTPGMLPSDVGYHEKAVHYLPAFHIAGMATLLLGLFVGSENVFVSKAPLDLPLIVKAIKECKPDRVLFVPPLLMALARFGLAGKDGFRNDVKCILSAAAPLGAEQQAEAYEVLGRVHVGQLWGMSETTGSVTSTSPLEPHRPGSVGRVQPGVEMRLIDDEGRDVKHGSPGEVLVRGPNTMLCYFRNETETAETIDKDGWLHSGDIGYVDDEGHLFIVDRKKELLKSKGFQVAPAELEALLMTHPAVLDAAVTGVRDRDGGDAARAFIALRAEHAKGENITSIATRTGPLTPSTSAKAKEISAYVAERAAKYKHLYGGIVFVDEIPKNPSGKILRRVLRDASQGGQSKL